MILLIISLIMGVIVAILIFEHSEFIEEMIYGVILAIMFYTVFAAPISLSFETETIEKSRTAIYSIKDETSIYGHFYIGAGTIESKVYYYYYIKNDNGYMLSKLDAEQVYIEECEDLENIGYICTYGKQLAKENWFINFGKYSLFIENKTTTIIKVPKNTMQIEFKID